MAVRDSGSRGSLRHTFSLLLDGLRHTSLLLLLPHLQCSGVVRRQFLGACELIWKDIAMPQDVAQAALGATESILIFETSCSTQTASQSPGHGDGRLLHQVGQFLARHRMLINCQGLPFRPVVNILTPCTGLQVGGVVMSTSMLLCGFFDKSTFLCHRRGL